MLLTVSISRLGENHKKYIVMYEDWYYCLLVPSINSIDFWQIKEIGTFFSIRVFYHGYGRLIGQQGKEKDHLLFHSTTFTRSQTFRHLFATLHVKWLSHIFNRNACIYQTATRWDLTTLSNCYLIDWWCVVYLLVELILGFVTAIFVTWETGGLELASTISLYYKRTD